MHINSNFERFSIECITYYAFLIKLNLNFLKKRHRSLCVKIFILLEFLLCNKWRLQIFNLPLANKKIFFANFLSYLVFHCEDSGEVEIFISF